MTECVTFWMSCIPPGAARPQPSCVLKGPSTLVDVSSIFHCKECDFCHVCHDEIESLRSGGHRKVIFLVPNTTV